MGKLRRTSQAIVDTLGEVGPIRDDRGRATAALAERLGDRGIRITAGAVTQQLLRLERDGLVERTVKGKLTYAIGTAGSLGDRAGELGCAICRRSPDGKCLLHKDDPEQTAPVCNADERGVHPRGSCPLHGLLTVGRVAGEQREAALAEFRARAEAGDPDRLVPEPAARPKIGDTRPAPTAAKANAEWGDLPPGMVDAAGQHVPRAAAGLPPFRPPVRERAAPAVPGFMEMAAQWAEDREELLKLRGMVEGLIDELGRTKTQMLEDAKTQAELVGNLRAQIALLRGSHVAHAS